MSIDNFNIEEYSEKIFQITSEAQFNRWALEAFAYQRNNCAVYKNYLSIIQKANFIPTHYSQIPFLPIELFKNNIIISGNFDCNNCDKLFTSSATTSMTPSKHYVKDISLYEKSFTKGFERKYGDSSKYNLLALLPSYLERDNSSLVYMVDFLIKQVKNSGGEGGFYLYNHQDLLGNIKKISIENTHPNKKKTILIGVSFALLDFAEFIGKILTDKEKKDIFKDIIIIETGGMKGRGKEIARKDLHSFIRNQLSVNQIDSEYGMAELLSQFYSNEDIFETSPWATIFIRDLRNPMRENKNNSIGGINIIDLANINSCCFIQTQDMGKVLSVNDSFTKKFTIEGRISGSELRGCNMLLE